MVKEISAMEQRYQAVLAVIADGRSVGEVAAQFGGLTRISGHSWLVVSSCSNHKVVVELLKAGWADLLEHSGYELIEQMTHHDFLFRRGAG